MGFNHSCLIILIAIESRLLVKEMMLDFILSNKNLENPIITHEHEHVPLVGTQQLLL